MNTIEKGKQDTEIETGLRAFLPAERIRTRYIDLVSFASDAGFYHLVPKAVVQPIHDADIIALFSFSQRHAIPLVFRTGGTSLSGQSITDGILVDLSQFWSRLSVEASGEQVRVQPGITGAMVNTYLKKYQRKIGPDPSSISAAMIGGILSNNASGMCCGVVQNSYHTTRHIRFILPSGHTFSTEVSSDYSRFETECGDLFHTLADIRDQLATDQLLSQTIRHKYRTKTTVGYSLNAFLDYQHPLDILAHLLIGAEGTLAFIAEAVLETVPDYPYKATALLYFPTIYAACQAIVPLTDAGAQMVELMDRASLRSVEDLPGMPSIVKTMPAEAAALLIEFQESTPEKVTDRVEQFLGASAPLSMLNEPVFTTHPKEQAFLWKVRKGLFPAVGAVRASGTTVILEDIAFPVDQFGDAIIDLQALFARYAYDNAIIFGHAKDGNIHFVVTQAFTTPDDIDRYDRFLRDVVSLVINKYQGTLKAEHGTGRNMAPFVQTEWGAEAYAIMKRIKAVIDPSGLLNPGVLISTNPLAHITHLKDLPSVEAEVDTCIECGYCEHTCPSRELTMTPRRRIVVRRALKTLERAGDKKNHQRLLDQYQYDGLETCAVDGLCATACPVDINTGDLVKRLRRENHSPLANRLALLIAQHFSLVEWSARTALILGSGLNHLFGPQTMTRLTSVLRKLISAIPQWSPQLMNPPDLSSLTNSRLNGTGGETHSQIVYMPACISRLMGTYPGKQKSLHETFLSICHKAQIEVIIPDAIQGSCCSQIFSSKGYAEAYRFTANKALEQLWQTSQQGRLPIVIDVSSCAYTLQKLRPVLTPINQENFDQLRILDSVDFLHDYILPGAQIKPVKSDIVLHPVCSLQKMKTEDKFTRVAEAFAQIVVVPKQSGCCGMAGDRGFLFPELTQSATRAEASEVRKHRYQGYYSSTKTCEMALSEATDQNYESILYLVDEGLVSM